MKMRLTPTVSLQEGNWVRERWWYKLAQVCQIWRHLVLAFASHLWPLPCLYPWYASSRHAGTFASPSACHRLPQRLSRLGRGRREHSPSTAAPRSRPPHPPSAASLEFAEAHFRCWNTSISRPGVIVSSTISARPHNDRYRLSNRIAIIHDTCRPRHTLTSTRPPICILLTKRFAQLALTHAPAGDTPCFFFLRFS